MLYHSACSSCQMIITIFFDKITCLTDNVTRICLFDIEDDIRRRDLPGWRPKMHYCSLASLKMMFSLHYLTFMPGDVMLSPIVISIFDVSIITSSVVTRPRQPMMRRRHENVKSCLFTKRHYAMSTRYLTDIYLDRHGNIIISDPSAGGDKRHYQPER